MAAARTCARNLDSLLGGSRCVLGVRGGGQPESGGGSNPEERHHRLGHSQSVECSAARGERAGYGMRRRVEIAPGSSARSHCRGSPTIWPELEVFSSEWRFKRSLEAGSRARPDRLRIRRLGSAELACVRGQASMPGPPLGRAPQTQPRGGRVHRSAACRAGARRGALEGAEESAVILSLRGKRADVSDCVCV